MMSGTSSRRRRVAGVGKFFGGENSPMVSFFSTVIPTFASVC